MVAGKERPSLRLTVIDCGSSATTWWLVRMRPFASKMTPDPVAVPTPVWPVCGSVELMPSATIVTTAGLTTLTMSTTEPLAATEPVLATVPAGRTAGVLGEWLVALMAAYVPPDARSADARTAPRTKPGPTDRRVVAFGVTPVSGVAKVNRSVDSSWVGGTGVWASACAGCDVGTCFEAGGVTPGGVSGVNDSYIGVSFCRDRVVMCERGVRERCEPMVCPISESSVITADGLRFLSQAVSEPSRMTLLSVSVVRNCPRQAAEAGIVGP